MSYKNVLLAIISVLAIVSSTVRAQDQVLIEKCIAVVKAKPGEVKEEPFYSFYESRNREKLAVIDVSETPFRFTAYGRTA
jgi:hypothetical protein